MASRFQKERVPFPEKGAGHQTRTNSRMVRGIQGKRRPIRRAIFCRGFIDGYLLPSDLSGKIAERRKLHFF
jgi:hypothetical protein